MAIGDAYKVDIQYKVPGSKQSFSYYLIVTADSILIDCETIAADTWTEVGPPLLAIAPVTVNFECVYVRKVLGDPIHPGTNALAGQDGTVLGAACPETTSAIFMFTSPVGSSRNNNRATWGAVAHLDSEGNNLTNAALTGTYDAVLTAIYSGLNIDGGRLEAAVRVNTIDKVPQTPPVYAQSPQGFVRATLKNNRNRRSKLTGFADQ